MLTILSNSFLQLFVFVVTESVGQFIIDVIITGHKDTSIIQSQGENIALITIFYEQNQTLDFKF